MLLCFLWLKQYLTFKANIKLHPYNRYVEQDLTVSCNAYERHLLCFSLDCGMRIVRHNLFALPLDIIGRLCSVIVVLSGHLLYYFLLLSYKEYQ